MDVGDACDFTRLDMSSNYIGEEGAEVLADMLTGNTSLTACHLTGMTGACTVRTQSCYVCMLRGGWSVTLLVALYPHICCHTCIIRQQFRRRGGWASWASDDAKFHTDRPEFVAFAFYFVYFYSFQRLAFSWSCCVLCVHTRCTIHADKGPPCLCLSLYRLI
jgi:hypothetical protein